MRGTVLKLSSSVSVLTVARRLEQLHRRLNGCVFEKTVGGYQITQFGEPLLALARRMEQVVVNADQFKASADDSMAGPVTLSIGEPMAQYLLREVLFAFTKRYPSIQLNINSSLVLLI